MFFWLGLLPSLSLLKQRSRILCEFQRTGILALFGGNSGRKQCAHTTVHKRNLSGPIRAKTFAADAP